MSKKIAFSRILHENVVYRSLIAKGGYLRPYFETIEDLKRQQTNDSGAQVRMFNNDCSQTTVQNGFCLISTIATSIDTFHKPYRKLL